MVCLDFCNYLCSCLDVSSIDTKEDSVLDVAKKALSFEQKMDKIAAYPSFYSASDGDLKSENLLTIITNIVMKIFGYRNTMDQLLSAAANFCAQLSNDDMQPEGIKRVAPGTYTSNGSTAQHIGDVNEDSVRATASTLGVFDGVSQGNCSGPFARAVNTMSGTLLEDLCATNRLGKMTGQQVTKHVLDSITSSLKRSLAFQDRKTWAMASTTGIFAALDENRVLKGGGIGDTGGFVFSQGQDPNWFYGKVEEPRNTQVTDGSFMVSVDGRSYSPGYEKESSFEVETKAGDLILLCSDGIVDSLDPENRALALKNIIENADFDKLVAGDKKVPKADSLQAEFPAHPTAHVATKRLRNYLASVAVSKEVYLLNTSDYAKPDDQGFVFKQV